MTKVTVTEKTEVLEPADFPDADIVPFTISDVRHVPFRGDRGLQDRIVLESEEHGDKVIWPNMTSLRVLVAKFGDDDVNWIGKKVPLVKVLANNPQTGKMKESFWVASESDGDAWESVAPRAPRGRPAAKKSVAKRGRSR